MITLSAVANTKGRYGIAVAAQKHIELLQAVCDVDVCEGPQAKAGIVYHHVAAPPLPPLWYTGKHVVGYWVVESSLASAEFKGTADACAQIWTCSQASARAIRALGTKTPVFVIPHPITAPEVLPNRKRRKTVTTLFAFSPGWERKNPEAVFAVWKAAAKDNSRLIVKARLAGPKHQEQLQALAGDDPRITLIFDDVEDMAPLYEQADIFLSLHRAGAFEMHIAEAAAHGVPVICTAVGGVLDYLDHQSACLIRGEQVPPRMDDQLNRAGAWLEADQHSAAAALMALQHDARRRIRMGQSARDSVMSLHHPEVITALMLNALKQLEGLPPSELVVTPPPPKPRRPLAHTPLLSPIRAGLEVMAKPGQHAEPGTPVVISHRRSGTHFLGSLLVRHWPVKAWLKTHDFPERLPGMQHPRLYILRNPIDALHSTWRWWREGASNYEIAAVMRQMSFEEWLGGKGGAAFGYRSCRPRDVDSFEVTRGQMYDPIQYWLDHWRAAGEAGIITLLYEDILTRPAVIEGMISQTLGVESTAALQPATAPVGLSPSADRTIGKAWSEWPEAARERLKAALTPAMLGGIGRASLEEWAGQPNQEGES